jgi:hypothetical protein
MTMLPPPHHPDEHLMHAKTQRKLRDAQGNKGSRGVTKGDVALVSGLAFAAILFLAFLVFLLF